MLKQFDKDGDGQLNETERAAMLAAMAGRSGGPRGPRLSQEEILKRFDKDGDGQLNETERAAMRAAMGGGAAGGPGARAEKGRPKGRATTLLRRQATAARPSPKAHDQPRQRSRRRQP